MSRKHFERIANELAISKPEDLTSLIQWRRDVRALAQACAAFNGAFDRERFLRACGYTQEG